MPSRENSPTLVVTGANGFIGGNLVAYFRGRGWKVRAWVHSVPEDKLADVYYERFDLEGGIDPARLEGVDFLIHAAHLRSERSSRADAINIDGAKAALAACRRREVKFVFLSSFAAKNRADSHYGRVKLAIEGLTDPAKDLVLRPGLVLGAGGLFAGMAATVMKRRIVPLVGGGRQPVQTVSIGDLCVVLEKGLLGGVSGNYMVASPEPVLLRELLAAIARRWSRRVFFVSVPLWLTFCGVRACELLGLRLSVNSDSVMGLKSLCRIDTSEDLRAFGVTVQTFSEWLRTAEPPGRRG